MWTLKRLKRLKEIDLSKVSDFDPIADRASPFRGTFDGQGKKIKNLKIDRSAKNFVGLFGYIGAGSVLKDIGLEGVDVEGRNQVGGLLGFNNQGRVENSYVTGKVKGGLGVGGLVGSNTGGTVQNSHATSGVEGNGSVGGLVGVNDGGRITNNNYWQQQIGRNTAAQGVGLVDLRNVIQQTENQLKALTAADTGWNAAIWEFEAGEYPKLAWQSE